MIIHYEAFGFPICNRCKSAMMEITINGTQMTQKCWGCKQQLSDKLYSAAHQEWLRRAEMKQKKPA